MNKAIGALVFGGTILSAGAAWAWTPPSVGAACRVGRSGGAEVTLIAGNYLGGRRVRDGIVDWKSFQGCFRSADACQSWLARHALSHPLQPGFATCTPVTIGGSARLR
jgi:hypothetical protein